MLQHLEAIANQGELSRWAKWFADDCYGWPKHLRTQMAAVATDMLRADTARLADLDAQAISDDASGARNRHYGRRLSATFRVDLREMFAEMAKSATIPSGADIRQLKRDATAFGEREGEPLDGKAMVDAAIHAGILQRASADDPGRYVCPIPSLTWWLDGKEHIVPPPPV